ncbi:MAG: hypothetical protein K8R02_01320 [Anaerohalosphaeraceae bacterium]|nr:hypothetical protein [Anaerohalosphaeraceae bacterium]
MLSIKDKKVFFATMRKAILVIFITCLIWVWADLSLDEDLLSQTITISASRENPRLWVTIEGGPDVQIKADLTGPKSKTSELKDKLASGKDKLEIVFDAEKENMAKTGDYEIADVRKFVTGSSKIRSYGLSVTAKTRPDKLKVKVVQLRERQLPVKCFDEADVEIPGAQMTPDIVTILAPEQINSAKVKLNLAEKNQARKAPVEKTPYIELSSGIIRQAESFVRVELPVTQSDMKPYAIRGTLGYILSDNLAGGGYRVEFIKRPDIGSIPIIATAEAKTAYGDKTFEVLLEINDDDINAEEITRSVIYNFPAKYVCEDKIRLRGETAEATFKLVSDDEPAAVAVPIP